VESGEVYEEDDGKFYYSEHRRSSVETRGDSTKAEKKSDIDAKKLNSVFMELIRDKPDPKEKWIVMAGKKPSKSIDNAASDNDMAVLQESFDAVTRVTCAIRKVAMELIKTGASSTSSELAAKGVKLCKMIIPSQNTVEELLYKDKSEVLGGEVREALQAAAGPYKELITYYNELVAVHRHVVNNSGAASGSAGRFKAIAA
jgi:hypothetical protein